jgi:hypothetical protein
VRAFASLVVLFLPVPLLGGCSGWHAYLAPVRVSVVRVPDARGLEIPYAVDRIHRVGLRAATLGYPCDESRMHQRYYVRGQEPFHGKRVARGTLVVLRLDYMHGQGVRVPPLPLRRGLHLCR